MSNDLIHRNGLRFSPFDIEQVLLDISGVQIGLAVAFENKHVGEEIGAYIVAAHGLHLSEERVLDYCRKRLGFDKSPKVVVFGKDIPMTASGEYQRARLKEKFAAWRETKFKDQMTR